MKPIDGDELIRRLERAGWIKNNAIEDSDEMIAVQSIIDDMPIISSVAVRDYEYQKLRKAWEYGTANQD